MNFLKMYPNNEYVIYDSVFDYYNKNIEEAFVRAFNEMFSKLLKLDEDELLKELASIINAKESEINKPMIKIIYKD